MGILDSIRNTVKRFVDNLKANKEPEKTEEETFVVAGPRDKWFERCKQALETQGFVNITTSAVLFQLTGQYQYKLRRTLIKPIPVQGEIQVTLMPENENTRIVAKATAPIDFLAPFDNPRQMIISAFKKGLADEGSPAR